MERRHVNGLLDRLRDAERGSRVTAEGIRSDYMSMDSSVCYR